MRLAGARGRGGVEVAHVVADLVGAKLRELGAGADAGRAAVARQRARDARARRRGRAPRRAPRASARALAAPRAVRRTRGLTPPRRASDVVVGRRGDRGEHALEQVVGGDALAQRVVGEHDPVAQHVGREVADIGDGA